MNFIIYLPKLYEWICFCNLDNQLVGRMSFNKYLFSISVIVIQAVFSLFAYKKFVEHDYGELESLICREFYEGEFFLFILLIALFEAFVNSRFLKLLTKILLIILVVGGNYFSLIGHEYFFAFYNTAWFCSVFAALFLLFLLIKKLCKNKKETI